MLRKLVVFTTTVLAGLLQAAPVPVTVSSGGSFVLAFDGRPTLPGVPPVIGTPVDYLSSVIYFSEFSFTDVSTSQTRVDFRMDVFNTSTAPLTSSSLSVIGFNTTPTIASGINSVSGAFDTVYRGDSLPGAGMVEFCVSDVLNCAGEGGVGVAQGTGATAYASLYFNSASLTSLTFDNAFVRYQGLTGVPSVSNGLGSPVPEASQYAILALGLGLVLWTRRSALAPTV